MGTAGLSNLTMVAQWLLGQPIQTPIKPCNGCWAGLSNPAMVYQTLLGWPIQTAGLSNPAMVAGLAYSNGWHGYQTLQPCNGWCNGCWPIETAGLSIEPCNGCRAGLFKQGNGCWAGLSNHAMVAGLVYQNRKQLLSYLPIKTGKIVAGLAFPTL